MRRIIELFIIFMIFVFLLPALLTKSHLFSEIKEVASSETGDKKQDENVNNNEDSDASDVKQENNNPVENYDYKEFSTIKLLHKENNSIEELPLDEYLLGVVSAEMPAKFAQEALNAQALVARTYTIYSIKNSNGKHGEASICDDSSCCQAWITKESRIARWEENVREEYWGKIEKAVNNTKGKVITYNGEVIDAFFHSNSGGITEVPASVWGGTNYPYLQSVETAGEDAYSQYSSEVTLSKEEFRNKILAKHSDLKIDFDMEDCIKVIEYNDAHRVKTMKVGNLNLSGVELRTILGLKSANFEASIDNDNIKFKVTGYGHGVGMSQTGADSMANEGKNYEEIIKHFYTGVEIVNF